MDQSELELALSDLPLGRIRYFDTIGSTNDLAADWVSQDAPDLSLIVADEQTRGRGRSGRKWYTPPGSALAFSLVLRPSEGEITTELSRATGLGALAVCTALEKKFKLVPKIKWPNDILLSDKKVSGVLAEAHWQGSELLALILGIGINIAPSSVPPEQSLSYPADCVVSVLGASVDRMTVLKNVLDELLYWRPKLYSPSFISAWEARLAYRDQMMLITPAGQASMQAEIVGLDPQGKLMLRLSTGEEVAVPTGEIQIRPLVDSSSI